MSAVSVLIMDDEPHNIMWLADYLEEKGFVVTIKTDVNSAVEALNLDDYRFAILDLNIPVSPPMSAAVAEKGDVYLQYPGLFAAWSARNFGYRDRQVVVYTVHRDPAIATEAEALRCTYIMKGRPRMLKNEIDEIMSYDPTAGDN